MPSITIRDVPHDVHRVLSARAAREGRSLQEHLRLELARLAEKPSREEWLERVREHRSAGSTLTTEEIVDAVSAERR